MLVIKFQLTSYYMLVIARLKYDLDHQLLIGDNADLKQMHFREDW